MNKAEHSLLERVFAAEVDAALTNGMHLVQTRSKVAKKLEADGFLRKRVVAFCGRLPIEVEGYELTDLGRLAYCMTCEEIDA